MYHTATRRKKMEIGIFGIFIIYYIHSSINEPLNIADVTNNRSIILQSFRPDFS